LISAWYVNEQWLTGASRDLQVTKIWAGSNEIVCPARPITPDKSPIASDPTPAFGPTAGRPAVWPPVIVRATGRVQSAHDLPAK
jgi:hypothetical protein